MNLLFSARARTGLKVALGSNAFSTRYQRRSRSNYASSASRLQVEPFATSFLPFHFASILSHSTPLFTCTHTHTHTLVRTIASRCRGISDINIVIRIINSRKTGLADVYIYGVSGHYRSNTVSIHVISRSISLPVYFPANLLGNVNRSGFGIVPSLPSRWRWIGARRSSLPRAS